MGKFRVLLAKIVLDSLVRWVVTRMWVMRMWRWLTQGFVSVVVEFEQKQTKKDPSRAFAVDRAQCLKQCTPHIFSSIHASDRSHSTGHTLEYLPYWQKLIWRASRMQFAHHWDEVRTQRVTEPFGGSLLGSLSWAEWSEWVLVGSWVSAWVSERCRWSGSSSAGLLYSSVGWWVSSVVHPLSTFHSVLPTLSVLVRSACCPSDTSLAHSSTQSPCFCSRRCLRM